MNVPIQNLVLYCVLTCAVGSGCGGQAPPTPPAAVDQNLRNLLGVKSISATIKSPKDQPYGIYAVLQFEDGKLIGFRHLESNKSEERFFDFAWRSQGDPVDAAYGSALAAATSAGPARSDWLTNLTVRSSGTAYNIHGKMFGQHDEWKIYGLGFSILGKDGKEHPDLFGEVMEELTRRKYAIALGARFFKSEDEMKKVMQALSLEVRKKSERSQSSQTTINPAL